MMKMCVEGVATPALALLKLCSAFLPYLCAICVRLDGRLVLEMAEELRPWDYPGARDSGFGASSLFQVPLESGHDEGVAVVARLRLDPLEVLVV